VNDIRASCLKAFDKLRGEARAHAEQRLEVAALEGVERHAYAREQRIEEAGAALSAVPEEKWQDLSDWLLRFAGGFDAACIRDRPTDRRASWSGAEGEAVARARLELNGALSHIDAAQGPRGLDAEHQSGRDMEGRLGRAFHEVGYTLERVRDDLMFAIGRLGDPKATYDDPDEDESLPFDLAQRRPAPRAFPELIRFWTDDCGRGADEKELFLTFARAALRSAANARGDSPAEWTAGLDEAFKRR